MGSATLHDLAQEDDLLIPLPDGDIVVLYPFARYGQFRKFMVVGRKQRLGGRSFRVMKIFGNRPRNGHAVEGGCSAADLIQYDEAFWRCISQNVSGFGHFHHEGGLPPGKIVRSAHPGEYPVH